MICPWSYDGGHIVSANQKEISKSGFKSRALEVMREVERTGHPVIITDRGRQALIMKKYHPDRVSALARLKGSVLRYDKPLGPVATDAWEALK